MKSYSIKNIILGLAGALLLMGCQNSETKGQSNPNQKEQAKGTVQLTEYSDYECPSCAYFYPIVEKLKDKYGERLQVTYKFFPLNMHQYSMLAARAAQTARNQGKFKEMHNLLFENQEQWSSSGNPQPIFVNYAEKIGLDMEQFKDDLNAAATQKAVMEQKNEGDERGVSSTPTFYINNEEVTSLPGNYKQFEALLDIYMKEAASAENN